MSDTTEIQREEDLHTIDAMLRHGGHFVQALARAAQMADSENLAKIKATWPEYWRRYAARQRRIEALMERRHPGALQLAATAEGRLCVPARYLTAAGHEHFEGRPAPLADLRWPEDDGEIGKVQLAVRELKLNGHLYEDVSMVISPGGGYLPV